MLPKTLELATREKVISTNGMLMGYSEVKNSEYIIDLSLVIRCVSGRCPHLLGTLDRKRH